VKRGIGMAVHTWGGFAAGGNPGNETTVTISRDGSVMVESSTQDLGTGQRTVSAIIPAEILGLEVADINVKSARVSWARRPVRAAALLCRRKRRRFCGPNGRSR